MPSTTQIPSDFMLFFTIFNYGKECITKFVTLTIFKHISVVCQQYEVNSHYCII
jgi:hypothetical protein